MAGPPVRHDPPPEAQPALEVRVEGVVVLTAPARVDEVVGAHDGADARARGGLEGGVVQLETLGGVSRRVSEWVSEWVGG